MSRAKNPRLSSDAVEAVRFLHDQGQGWTQLASQLNISEQQLHKMLSGQRGLSGDAAPALSRLVDMPTGSLVCE